MDHGDALKSCTIHVRCNDNISYSVIVWRSKRGVAPPQRINARSSSVQAAFCGERRALSRGLSWTLCSVSAGKRRFQMIYRSVDVVPIRLAPVAGWLFSARVYWGFNDRIVHLTPGPCRRNKLIITPVGTFLTMSQVESRATSSFQDPFLSFWWWWWLLWLLW